MKYIDMENWKRKDHFNYYKNFDYPQFNICGNVDITTFYHYVKEQGLPFFVSLVYAASKTANSIEEFRLRIRGDKVVEHEKVSPSFTLLVEEEVFSFCTSNYEEEFETFKDQTLKQMDLVKQNASLEDELGRDDFLFITSTPWISFTSLSHPIQMNPEDSVPRIAWGKYFEEGGRIKLPLSVQAHHSLIDGIHMGKFFNRFQELLDDPKTCFEG